MKTIRNALLAPLLAALLAPLLALAACFGGPRTTTTAERADLDSILATLETGLDVAKLAGKIPPDHYAKAMQQVADLRASIAASAASPVTVDDLFRRALRIAADWAITLDK